MTGAMFIADCLKQEGVTKVFGQCGHTNYALIDACHKLGIEYVSFRHEQMAAHAADAYFRVSHKLAVVNVHLSPGHDQRPDRRCVGRRRLDADAGDRRQHAVVSPRARAAPGHPLPRRRVAGRHLPPDLQARLAHRRREVPVGCDAARAERRADRPSRRGAARRADGRVLTADERRAGHRGPASELRARRRRPRKASRPPRRCCSEQRLRSSSPATASPSRRRAASCATSRNCWAPRWRRR